jgi:hypothetical protein
MWLLLMAQTYNNQLPARITADNNSVRRTRGSLRALTNSSRNFPITIAAKRRIIPQTTRCTMISRGGTSVRAFQYMIPRPQIRKADPAENTPDIDSDFNLDICALVIIKKPALKCPGLLWYNIWFHIIEKPTNS